MSKADQDPVLRSARPEAIVVFITWACALTYTVSYCYRHGYNRSAEDLEFVHLFWGIAFPDWVFWGIVAPWSACFLMAGWFSFVFMRDADLGEELPDGEDTGGLSGGETKTPHPGPLPGGEREEA